MTNANIQRLINNQKFEHSGHAFAGNRGGMEDFNRLYPVLSRLPAVKLTKWMSMIDTMRSTHPGCGACTAKILAYSILFTKSHAPKISNHYRELFESVMARFIARAAPRDIMAEVLCSFEGRKPEPSPRESSTTASYLTSDLFANLEDDETEENRWGMR